MVIDGDELSERDSDDADPGLTWAWEQVVGSDDSSSAPSFDSERGLAEDAVASNADFSLPEDTWGDQAADAGPAEPAFPSGSQSDDIWSVAQEAGAPVFEESVVGDPPTGNAEGLSIGASSVGNPAVPPAPRRPTLAAAPVPGGRQSGLRRVLRARRTAPKAVLALLVLATGGLLLALAARPPDTPRVNATEQIGAAFLQPASTMPASTVPLAPSTTLTTPTTSSPSIDGEAPPTTLASPSVAATPATTPVVTVAPRSPVLSVAATPPVAPQEDPPPAPTPEATVAPPPPATIVLLPEETTVTTRRPRATVPETTVAPSTTTPTSDDLPAGED